MRRKLLMLTAALSLTLAAAILPAPAGAWPTCSCSFCLLNNLQALCSQGGTTMQCSTYYINFCQP